MSPVTRRRAGWIAILAIAALIVMFQLAPTSWAAQLQPAQHRALTGHATAKAKSPCAKLLSAKACAAVVVVGHRFTEYAPAHTDEDTLAAIAYARHHGINHTESDYWYSSEGTAWLWHDSNFCRVASTASLAAAKMPCTQSPHHTSDAQWALIRTKGGAKATRLSTVIDYAIRYRIHVKMEIKWDPTPAQAQLIRGQAVTAAHKYGHSANYMGWYEAPLKPRAATASSAAVKGCTLLGIERLRAVGFGYLGVKSEVRCPMSDAAVGRWQFATQDLAQLTPGHVKAMKRLGCAVGNKRSDNPNTWAYLVRNGASFIIAATPTKLATWIGHR